MKVSSIVLSTAALLGLCGMPETVSASPPVALTRLDHLAAGRKSITVFAANAATASAKARAQNPRWTVVSVRKSNNDPKSMAYRVVLKK